MTFLQRVRRAAHSAGYSWSLPLTEVSPYGQEVTHTWRAGAERDGDLRSVTVLVVNDSIEQVLLQDGDLTLERKASFDSLCLCLYAAILPRWLPLSEGTSEGVWHAHDQDSPS